MSDTVTTEDQTFFIWDVTSDPIRGEDGRWALDIVWFDKEGGTDDAPGMGQGTIWAPSFECAVGVQKYFRENVNPLGPQELDEIYESVRTKHITKGH